MNEENVRPWGRYDILLDEEYCKVKKITVNPKGILSYQSHQKRKEIWEIVQGKGIVTIGSSDAPNPVEISVDYGYVVVILPKEKHRISNIGENSLIFIEIQTGTYFGEDDIERFEDDYGRK